MGGNVCLARIENYSIKASVPQEIIFIFALDAQNIQAVFIDQTMLTKPNKW